MSSQTYSSFVSAGTLPPNVYPYVANTFPSVIDPNAAVGPNPLPGFSGYPTLGLFDTIYSVVQNRSWAISEGVNLIPGNALGTSNYTASQWLGHAFGNGATLVNVFAFQNPSSVNPLDILGQTTVSADSLNSYRQFLQGAKYNTTVVVGNVGVVGNVSVILLIVVVLLFGFV